MFAMNSSNPNYYSKIVILSSLLIIGIAIRWSFVVANDFPINDGGLFYVMIRDLQSNNFNIPQYTSYNNANIPYVYPPLGFYLVGVIDRLTSVNLINLMRWIPFIISVFSIPIYFLLCMDILKNINLAIMSTAALLFMPLSYRWLIMGGGVTRSLGFLFALLSLHTIFLLYVTGKYKYLFLSSIFTAFTILSHPSLSWFLVYSIVIFFIFFSRTKDGFIKTVFVGAISFAIISPWFIHIIIQHGNSFFLALADSGSTPFIGIIRLVLLDISPDITLFPLVHVLGVIGLAVTLINKNFFLPTWLLSTYLFQSRDANERMIVPLAMLAGIGTVAIYSLLDKAQSSRWKRVFIYSTIVFILIYSIFSTFLGPKSLISSITEQDFQAMEWINKNTSEHSLVLVIPYDDWYVDRISEWFPALTNRISISVVQGYEWFGNFSNRIEEHEELKQCIYTGVECLEKWSRKTGSIYSYLYLPKPCITDYDFEIDMCDSLRQALLVNKQYKMVFDGPGATIYKYHK